MSYLLIVSTDVVDIGSEHFVVCRAYIYMCSVSYYAELPVLLYLVQCLVYHMLSKTRSSRNLHRVISEVLVLSLLVVYKIPYSSCM